MKYVITGLLMFFCVDVAVAQQNVVQLTNLYEKLEANYPVAMKPETQQQITNLQQQLSQTGWYPEITLNGNVSYQSEVTEVSFAPMAPEFNKDHYSISAEVSQPLYEAGRVSKMKTLNDLQGKAAEAGFEVEMNNLRSQLDQMYFGILNAQKQLEIIGVIKENLEEQLRRLKVMVKNEVMLPGNQYVLEAEILKLNQQEIQIQASIQAGIDALGILTGQEIDSGAELRMPQSTTLAGGDILRPEYDLFRFQQQSLAAQMDLTGSDKLPVISAYGRTAYGRPGFNAFDNDLHFFWIVGVRAQWSFRNWKNSDKKTQVLELQKDQIRSDEQAFTKQLESSFAQKGNAIDALRQQIDIDEQVLELRTKVVDEKQQQLNEGVITSTEYLTELNAQNQATLNVELHKLQLVQAQYELLRLRGNVWY